jgi:glucose-6-phosphate isomerase
MRYIPHGAADETAPETISQTEAYAQTILHGAERQDVSSHEGALALPFIDQSGDVVRATSYFSGIEHLVLVGIGGSSLGTEAVYEALRGTEQGIDLTILDALSPARLGRMMHMLAGKGIPPDKIGVVLVSKSGGTTETIANYAMLRKAMSERLGGTPRTLVITDEGSKLDSVAASASFERFHIPHAVGGRYSVFSAVGIIPLSILGIDTGAFLRGARELLSDPGVTASALTSAGTIAKTGVSGTIDTFLFDPELRAYGFWRRQLLGESLGKSVALDGTKAIYGPLPTVSTVGDLHSIAQLYLAGPRGIHTDFITQDSYDDAPLGVAEPNSILPHLAGHGAQDISFALEKSVIASYKDRRLPHAEYRLTLRSASELGALMAFNMFETMLTASFMGIDAFDQPNVELYKTKMRDILASAE